MTHPILRHQVPAGVAAETVDVRSPRFAADDPAAAVYRVKVPTRRDRIEWQSDLAVAGLRHPGNDELLRVLREDVTANCADAGGLLEIVDAFEADVAAVDAGERQAVDAELERQYRLIEDDVRRNCEPFRRLEADRRRFFALLPYHTVPRFLLGWENGPAAFQRSGDLVPPALVERIDETDLLAIHAKAIELMGVEAAARKNSVSPSASPSAPSSSTADAKPRTAPGGKSTGSGTRKTRGSASTRAG